MMENVEGIVKNSDIRIIMCSGMKPVLNGEAEIELTCPHCKGSYEKMIKYNSEPIRGETCELCNKQYLIKTSIKINLATQKI
ncbi:MAG: hypothetical protein ABH811_00025 [archaeon]